MFRSLPVGPLPVRASLACASRAATDSETSESSTGTNSESGGGTDDEGADGSRIDVRVSGLKGVGLTVARVGETFTTTDDQMFETLAPEGDPVAVGVLADADLAVWRLTADGVVDRGFGDDGLWVWDGVVGRDLGWSLGIDPMGLVVVSASSVQNEDGVAMAILRLVP